MPDRLHDPIRRLVAIVSHLRSADGCPWDREQTVRSLRPYLIEECHEFLAAIESGKTDDIIDELGDLLLQVVFFAQLYSEQDAFDLDQAADAICQKMIRRHPHVFADTEIADRPSLNQQWNAIKQAERQNADNSLFATLPKGLPALQLAQKVGTKAAQVGFDWQNIAGVFEKLLEEKGELEAALIDGTAQQIEEELGDLLFTVVNLARHLNIDAESALQQTVNRFMHRFQHIERSLAEENLAPVDVTSDELNALWNEAKNAH